MRRYLDAVLIALAAFSPASADNLDTVLGRYVRDGLVDYAALRSDAGFGGHVEGLSKIDPDGLATRDERLAFWINTYNTLVLKGVADHYPIRSVRDVGQPGKWSFFREIEFTVGGRKLTLDMIENEIVRPVYRDPRAHFALVCASAGCPKLPSRAFRAESLQADLEGATRRFINDPGKVRVDRKAGVIFLSQIFKWYEEDFVRSSGSVTRFVSGYLEGGLPEGLRVEYLDYSWALNDAGSAP